MLLLECQQSFQLFAFTVMNVHFVQQHCEQHSKIYQWSHLVDVLAQLLRIRLHFACPCKKVLSDWRSSSNPQRVNLSTRPPGMLRPKNIPCSSSGGSCSMQLWRAQVLGFIDVLKTYPHVSSWVITSSVQCKSLYHANRY